jgi:N-acetylneuraminic acid mutarotase
MEWMLAGFITAVFLGDISKCQAVEPFWTQRSHMPTPRWMHTSAVVNGKIYVIGGVSSEPANWQNESGEILSTVEEYDPATDTWTRKADMPTARGWLPPSSPVVDGKIYVIGGGDDVVWDLPTLEMYDPSTDTWASKDDMPTPRWCLATCAVNGKIYAIGGAPNSYSALKKVEVYDPATNIWTRKADMLIGRWGLCANVVNGKIYTIGGAGFMGGWSTVEEYDPLIDTWTAKVGLPTPRRNMASSVLCGQIYVMGGWKNSGSRPYSTVEVYNPAMDSWQTIADMPAIRSSLTSSVVRGKIYATGGTDRIHPCLATPTVYEFGAPPPDFNWDGIVDSADMCIMIDNWGTGETLCDIAPPLFGDGIVDVQDLIVLAEHLFEEVEVYDPTLVAHWALDEIGGTIAYDSAGTCDGTFLRDPLWQPDGGMVDGALHFDGVDDCILTSSLPNSIEGPFSVFAWIKGGVPGQVVISQRGGVNWLCADTSEGNLMTELMGTGRSVAILPSQAIITDGNWHRIGLVWDGSHRTLYVDDLAVADDTLANLEVSDNGLYIGTGKAMEPGSFWSGLIDDVRIYNRAVRP